jgi:hypothetical protein
MIIEGLASDHFDRYGHDGIMLAKTRDGQRISESTVKDPDRFIGYLHLLHTTGGLTIDTRKLRVRRLVKILENL